MGKSRFSAILSVALVFLSGALIGAVGNRLYMVNTGQNPIVQARPPERSPEEMRKHLTEEMRTEVKLDNQQVQELDKIYDHTREQFDEMHKRWNGESRAARDKQTEEIKAMLHPDQVALFDQLRAKHDAERKARHKGDPKGDKGRP